MPWSDKGIKGSWIASSAVIHPSVRLGKGLYIGANVVIHENTIIADRVAIHDNSVIGRPKHRPGQPMEYSDGYTIVREDTVIGTNVTIYTGTDIGRRVLVGDGVRIREDCVVYDDSIVGSNSTFQKLVRMGRRSRVIDLSHITNSVIIGNDVFISTGVLTMDDNSFAGKNQNDTNLYAPKIENGAAIGGGAILLPGVIVRKNAIVGAGSVVTKDVEEGTTVMGVPARRKHDIGFDGTPGAPSHAQLGRRPITFDPD